jgi:hypothetical protein
VVLLRRHLPAAVTGIRVPARDAPEARPIAYTEWRAAYPRADPRRAAELIAPVAALRAALVYQAFLDGIEASERLYHEADVPACLRRALAAACRNR